MNPFQGGAVMQYAPGVQDRSGEILAQGISSGSAGLGHGLSKLGEYFQKQKDEEKRRAREFKSLVEYADVTGMMPKDKAMTMDLDSVKGVVQGNIFKQKAQEIQQQQQLRKAQLGEALARTAQLGQQQKVDSDFAGFTGAMADAPNLDNRLSAYYEADSNEMPNRPAPLPMAEYARGLAGQFPSAPQHNYFRDYMQTLQPNGAAGDVTFSEDPVTGSRFGRLGNSLLPSGMNPEKSKPSVQTIYDQSGQPFNVMTDPRTGRTTFAPRVKQSAGDHPWLLSDDEEEFKTGVRGIKDPAERDRVLSARTQVLRSLGKNDPFANMMKAFTGGEPAKPAAGSAAGGSGRAPAPPKKYFWAKDGKLHDQPEPAE